MTKISMTAILVYLAIAIAAIIGYGMNVYKIFALDFQAPYKAEVIRGVGIFVPPVGVITGYVNISD